MKKNLLILTCLFILALKGFSQGNLNLVIFSEDGDQFYAFVNGVKQNETPSSNVKVTNLNSSNLSLRIEFNDKTLPQLKQNMSLEMGFEHTTRIVRDMKRQLKLRYFGQTPLNQATAGSAQVTEYHSAENQADNGNAQADDNVVTTATTTTSQSYHDGNASVSINMGGAGISMNMSGMDPNNSTMNTTTSTTVNTGKSTSSGFSTASTSHEQAGQHVDKKEQHIDKNEQYVDKHEQHIDKPVPHDEKNKAENSVNNTCATPMTAANFATMKKSVESKPFSDTKMSTAKVATKNACLSVNQVKSICKLFHMDDDKLAFAKYAYDHCSDKANYYQVSEAFTFSGTTKEFNQFLESK